jgi:hypothetical protein
MRTSQISRLLKSSVLLVVVMYLLTGSARSQQSTNGTSQRVEESQILHAQLDTMRQDSDRLFTTVYWALGTLISVTFAVAVLGWYVNFRVYERDRNALLGELTALNSQRASENLEAMRRSFEELESQLRTAIAQASSVAEKQVEQKVDRFSANVKQEINSLSYHAAEFKGQWLEEKGPLLAAWFEYRNMLVEATAMGESWPGYALGNMKRVLDKGVRLNHHHVLEISHLLSKLPPGYSSDVERIRVLVAAAHE